MSAVLKPVLFHLRPMIEADLPDVMLIEQLSYEYPWTPGIFRDCMRIGYPCWVLERAGRIEGYGVMTVAAGEAHILNICVRPGERHKGHGRALLHHLLAEAVLHHASSAFLEVRPSNAGAIALYQRDGFCEVGYRRSYYPAARGREDALILARSLSAVR